MNKILQKLAGGDRRSIGRADEVVADVLSDSALFGVVFNGIFHDDPIISMRAADAIEKITARRPEYLQPYKTQLIEQAAPSNRQEVRWHVAQMLPRLTVSPVEQATIVDILVGYLTDRSKIVKTFAMQALADFAERDTSLRPMVVPLLEDLTKTGSPAMQSRGRKLLARLRKRGR